MRRRILWLIACVGPVALASAAVALAGGSPSVDEIVQKNAVARGGLEAWRKVETMVSIGHLGAADGSGSTVPFMMEARRPNRSHFEIRAANREIAMRVYDGSAGWNLHGSTAADADLRPYSPDELKFARDNFVIDGPLLDHAVKGVAVMNEGMEVVDQHEAYRLKLTLPSGAEDHLWIDAKTFLDLRLDRSTRTALGQAGSVTIFYRDYQTINGLRIPVVLETGSNPARPAESMVIDRLAINPPLGDGVFAKPSLPRRRAITIGSGPQDARRAP